MKSFTFAAVASATVPFVAALKSSTGGGGAKIINNCNYDIPIEAVPAMASGVENALLSSHTLKAAGNGAQSEWSTPWVQLQTAGGWAIKINPLNDINNILQYEYTWNDKDDQVWFDASFVNGKESTLPFWQFSGKDSGVKTHRCSYHFDKDDKRGMQPAAPPSATVYMVLCPAGVTKLPDCPPDTYPEATLEPLSLEAPKESATSAPQSTTFQTSAAPSTSSPTADFNLKQAQVQQAEPTSEVKTTTSAPVVENTPTPVADDVDVAIVYETKVVTAVVTETAHARRRRHEHRHPHGHSH